jgi:hypothetical protein
MKTAGIWVVAVACFATIAVAQVATGKLTVELTANGQAAAGTVEILPAQGGSAAAQGASGAAFDVPAGAYDVKATLTDAIDDPQRTIGGIDVAAGEGRTVRVDFQVGRVTLVCRKGDVDVTGDAKLRRPGSSAWLPAVRCGETFLVSGGTYEAQVTASGATQAVSIDFLQVMAGAAQRLPIDLRDSRKSSVHRRNP